MGVIPWYYAIGSSENILNLLLEYNDRISIIFCHLLHMGKPGKPGISAVRTINHCLGSGHETMVCAICLSILLWIYDMARFPGGTFVSWWYLLRICSPVTDMQHSYNARYSTDDWHLAYMFSLVHFSVEVCAWEECFPILSAQGEIPASGSTHPSRWLPPSRENKIEQGWQGVTFQMHSPEN